MPFFKIGDGQSNKMMEKPCADVEMQRVLHDDDDQGATRRGGDLYGHEDAEAEREHDEEIDVASGNYLVDGELEIEGAGDDEYLEYQREEQYLREGMLA